MDTYWYAFKLMNYNNQQFFLKKQYAHTLANDDIENICDTVFSQVTDEIERRIESL
jgi:hypothetical protein